MDCQGGRAEVEASTERQWTTSSKCKLFCWVSSDIGTVRVLESQLMQKMDQIPHPAGEGSWWGMGVSRGNGTPGQPPFSTSARAAAGTAGVELGSSAEMALGAHTCHPTRHQRSMERMQGRSSKSGREATGNFLCGSHKSFQSVVIRFLMAKLRNY